MTIKPVATDLNQFLNGFKIFLKLGNQQPE